ncbi:MAG: S24 family peptidase [Candidatus Saccharimonas sp.]
MNEIQEKLLLLARTVDLEKTRRVDLVDMVGCKYPSQISHHMGQLLKHGHLVKLGGRLVPAMKTAAGMIKIPIMGEADCGEATKFADGRIVDNLLVSPSMIASNNHSSLFALVAKGDSMNASNVQGKSIEDGDYIIVEKKDNFIPKDGDVVVSNIGGLANVKKFKHEVDRIVLMSQSRRQADFLPIFIHENDDYSVEGRVVDVVKAAQ